MSHTINPPMIFEVTCEETLERSYRVTAHDGAEALAMFSPDATAIPYGAELVDENLVNQRVALRVELVDP